MTPPASPSRTISSAPTELQQEPRHIMNRERVFAFGPIHRGALGFARMSSPMASARIKLDPATVEAIARRVVQLLERRGLQGRELVDAAELARRLGIERSWVYTHAIELGAVKLGNGAKPRLRFDPEVAAKALKRVGESAAAPPARSGERAGQPRGDGRSVVPLLPVRGENQPPSAA